MIGDRAGGISGFYAIIRIIKSRGKSGWIRQGFAMVWRYPLVPLSECARKESIFRGVYSWT